MTCFKDDSLSVLIAMLLREVVNDFTVRHGNGTTSTPFLFICDLQSVDCSKGENYLADFALTSSKVFYLVIQLHEIVFLFW